MQNISENNLSPEAQAIAGFREYVRGHRGWLGAVYRWGDGEGAMLIEALQDELGVEPPEPSENKPGRARKPIPRDTARAVYERDLYRCVTCGTHLDLTLDHRIPHCRGGADTASNLQVMCRACNCKKGAL